MIGPLLVTFLGTLGPSSMEGLMGWEPGNREFQNKQEEVGDVEAEGRACFIFV